MGRDCSTVVARCGPTREWDAGLAGGGRCRARHGDWAMRMRFCGEITRGSGLFVDERHLRAPFAPKPGRMTQSPCLKVDLRVRSRNRTPPRGGSVWPQSSGGNVMGMRCAC